MKQFEVTVIFAKAPQFVCTVQAADKEQAKRYARVRAVDFGFSERPKRFEVREAWRQ
jgi:hypothetical protein